MLQTPILRYTNFPCTRCIQSPCEQ